MDKIFITAAASVTGDDVRDARLGSRFGRMDLSSQLALLAVESLGVNFDALPRERIAICLAAKAGSLSTDVEFWKGRDGAGGPSPTLFTYTLPSAAIGEIAIRHRLTGPNLCFVGNGKNVLPEAAALLRGGEADGCVCVYVNVVSPGLAQIIFTPSAASACAVFLQRGTPSTASARPAGVQTSTVSVDEMKIELQRAETVLGVPRELGEFGRDIELFCANLRPQKLTK